MHACDICGLHGTHEYHGVQTSAREAHNTISLPGCHTQSCPTGNYTTQHMLRCYVRKASADKPVDTTGVQKGFHTLVSVANAPVPAAYTATGGRVEMECSASTRPKNVLRRAADELVFSSADDSATRSMEAPVKFID